MMRTSSLGGLLALLGCASLSSGCIAPRLFQTQTEVVTPLDSAAVFGPEATVTFGQERIVFSWDAASRRYSPQARGDSLISAFRVARLQGDTFLLQLRAEDEDGYLLTLFKISGTREIAPLTCDARPTQAQEFGVRLDVGEGLLVQLAGDRAAIIRFLSNTLGSCTRPLQVAAVNPPKEELAKQVATGAAPGAARCACPAGACVQGMVTDPPGAALPGATVRLVPKGIVRPGPGTTSNESGSFFLSGVPSGDYDLMITLTGFARVAVPLSIRTGVTYVFDEPLAIPIASSSETLVVSSRPRLCTGSDRR